MSRISFLVEIGLVLLVALFSGCGKDSGTTKPEPDNVPPAVPVNFLAEQISGAKVRLTWSPSSDNVGIAKYQVRAMTPYRDDVVDVSDTSFVDNYPYSWELNKYAVRAVDTADNVSAYSDTVSIIVIPTAADLPGSWTLNSIADTTFICDLDFAGQYDRICFEILPDSNIAGKANWGVFERDQNPGCTVCSVFAGGVAVSGRYYGPTMVLQLAADRCITYGTIVLTLVDNPNWPPGSRLKTAEGSFNVGGYGSTSAGRITALRNEGGHCGVYP